MARLKQSVAWPRWMPGCALMALWGLASCASLLAQDIHPVSSNAVQGERVSPPQGQGIEAIPTGAINARENLNPVPDATVSSQPTFADSDKNGEASSRLTEEIPEVPSDPDANSDFPVTDFVGTMPKPGLIDFGSFADPNGSGFGISLSPEPTFSSPTLANGRKQTTATPQMKDADAIMNPFTHTVTAPLGSVIHGAGSATETFLGPAKSE